LTRRRILRVAATLAVTSACAAYIFWKVDLGTTAHILANVEPGYFLGALAIQVAVTFPMAWRWQQLLRAHEIAERPPWLLRTYFVSFTAAQVLPTALGGDATRIYEGSRRHPGRAGAIAGTVLLERALGGAATLTLAAAGFLLAIGRYDIGAYLWLELAFVLATVLLGFLLFSRSLRGLLARTVPALRRLRIERPLRAAYEGIHSFRKNARLVVLMFLLTTFVQSFRVLAIWLGGESVGVHLSPRPYYVLGPLLFLVMLVPFTVNGLAVREAFFVSFLTKLGVGADPAFAAGFVFFLVFVGVALPGLAILAWENLRGIAAREAAQQ
jgi:uncharacterized protein (TIRG00374 family)